MLMVILRALNAYVRFVFQLAPAHPARHADAIRVMAALLKFGTSPA